MIRLDRIALREIRLPLVEPFRTVRGEVRERRILLLELVDADGSSMWSECVAQGEEGYSFETVDTCWTMIEERIAPRFVGRTIAKPMQFGVIADLRRFPMAHASVEMGAWALFALSEGVPLAYMLARASSVEARPDPRPHVEAGIALGMQESPDAAAERARAAFAEGYRRVKLKVGPADAVAVTRATRAAVGPAAQLTIDANASFSLNDPVHVAALEELDAFGLAMIEQPLAAGDLGPHAELQRSMSTPICLDESIGSLQRAQEMVSFGSGRVINMKPGRVGGFGDALAIHDFASAKGVRLWCGGMLESGIGRAYNVALASLPGFTDPGDLSPSARYWARDIVVPEWTMDRAGRVKVPLERPGLGVDVDIGFIDDCTVRSAEIRAR